MYRDILYREVASTKRKQAEKYSGGDKRMILAQADYFETLAAAEEARRDEAERDEFRQEILEAVDEKLNSFVSQRQRNRPQTPDSVGSNPTGATKTQRVIGFLSSWNPLKK